MGMGIANWRNTSSRILARDRYICGICNLPISRVWRITDPYRASVDHIIPRAFGGTHADHNLRAAHFVCNSRRGAMQRGRKRRNGPPMARASRWG